MTFSMDRATLGSIACRAATMKERFRDPYFVPVDTPTDLLAERIETWIARAARGDGAAFARDLSQRGLQPEEATQYLVDVQLRDPFRLPAWILRLEPLVKGTDFSSQTHGVSGLLEPFLRGAARWLEQRCMAVPLSITVEARRGLVQRLETRWLDVVLPCVLAERKVDAVLKQNGSFSRLGSARDWIECFDAYPVLARLFETVHHLWQVECQEFLVRLTQDLHIVEDQFLDRDGDTQLVDIQAGAGDSHCEGRAVMLLTFSNGKVVYKPRDLRIAAWFVELTETLNPLLSTPLHLRRVVARRGYGFEEFVEQQPECSEPEVRAFFRRAGMQLRLLQLVRGTDFHCGNVRIHGAHPVLMDLECLFSPLESAGRVECVGLLPQWIIGDPGQPAVSIGGLNRGGTSRLPFRSPSVVLGETPQLVSAYEGTDLEASLPRIQGESVAISEHAPSLLDGYQEMDVCLRDRESLIAGVGGLLERAASLPVRIIFRETRVYSLLLAESLQPAFLRAGCDRDLFLERLHLAASEQPTRHAPLVNREIDAARVLDIPYFSLLPGQRSLHSDGDFEVEEFFDRSALTCATADLLRRGAKDLRFDLDCIRSALSVLDSNEDLVWPPLPSSRSELSDEALVAAAVRVADVIAAHATDLGTKWEGLFFRPTAGVNILGRLPPDLLSGTAGLAIVFAEMFRATGEKRFRVLAERCLGEPLVTSDLGRFCGAFWGGAGSQIYALKRCAAALDDPSLAHRADSLFLALPHDRLLANAPVDVVSGLAGLCLASRAEAGPAVQRQLSAICDRLGALWSQYGSWPSPPYPTEQLEFLPDTAVGVAYALSEHAQDENAFGMRDAVEKARPTPGNALVALTTNARSEEPSRWWGLLRWVNDARTSPFDALSLAELALAAFGNRREEDDLRIARAVACHIVAHFDASGLWLPESLAAERHRLSAITGLGAVAYLLLRVTNPELGSLRLVR